MESQSTQERKSEKIREFEFSRANTKTKQKIGPMKISTIKRKFLAFIFESYKL